MQLKLWHIIQYLSAVKVAGAFLIDTEMHHGRIFLQIIVAVAKGVVQRSQRQEEDDEVNECKMTNG